jgi:hypothetical protein
MAVSTSGHTPGPWDWLAVGANASGGHHLYIIDKDGRKIAALWGKADEKAANARLIAAATDLLKTGNAMADTAIQLIQAFCNDEDWHDLADRLNDQVYEFRGIAIATTKGGDL